MRNFLFVISLILLLTGCSNSVEIILPSSLGKVNKALVVIPGDLWLGDIGNDLKEKSNKLIDGLPQPEKTFSLSQVAPHGFNNMMRKTRNILIVEEADTTQFTVRYNKFAKPQTIVYISAPNKEELLQMVKDHSDDVINTFKASDIVFQQQIFKRKKLEDIDFKTLQKLNISLIIPKGYRIVEDTGDFLWLRQHLTSGIAKGAGSNNLLVYSLPFDVKKDVKKSIKTIRDSIGKVYIPGAKEGMYMITEVAREVVTHEVNITDRKAYETRGTWEVKNDFMAGPFLNYVIDDSENNRRLVIEGFTYAPSINKREFIFELESIAKSVEIR